MQSSRFFASAAVLAAAAVSASPAFAQVATVSGSAVGARHWTFHHEHVLGTSLEMTVQAPTLAAARAAEAAMLVAFDRDEARLSTWRADSEASRWAATRFVPVTVSTELFDVLAGFDYWRERTNGALDASVEAATRLWKQSAEAGRVPSAQEIALVRESMQQPHWALDRTAGTATRLSDVPLAFASFVKSYVSSRAADAALAAGATGVSVNVGGDVIVRGNLVQLVAVADPRASAENDPAMEQVAVRDRAVATSGSYRRGFDLQDGHYSHLIDPHTAEPVGEVLSSTVIARDAATAGALATAFSVMPVEASARLAATEPGVQYLLVLASGGQVRSANWPGAPVAKPAGYTPAAAPGAGLWNPAYELDLELNLPRMDDARYRRPYVAVWIEDADHFPVRTLALWHQNPRWLPDLKQWYREDQVRTLAEGTDVSKTISAATRPPGKYALKWDGKDNEGKLVKAGRYTVCVEAAREHGGYDLQRHELDFDAKAQQLTLPAAKELGATTLDYRKR